MNRAQTDIEKWFSKDWEMSMLNNWVKDGFEILGNKVV